MSTTTTSYIDPKILTRNVVVDELEQTVSGEGLFDVLMDTATKHLRAQFNANRIREEDYATSYVDIYKATLGAAIQAWEMSLKDEEKEAQIALIKAQTETQIQTTSKTIAEIADIISKTKNLTAMTSHNFNKTAANQKVTTKMDVDTVTTVSPDLKLVAISKPDDIANGDL